MKLVIGSILILLGSILEVLYYIFRYTSEGTHTAWAIVQGVSLTVLLIAFFILSTEKSKWWFIPALILALYSIANTSAGQRQALINKAKTEVSIANDGQIEDLEATISRKVERYDKIAGMLDASISDFDDYWEWQNTTKKYEEDQSELLNDIESLNREVSELRNPIIEVSSNMEIYVFWGEVFGWENTDRIQFLMQVVFSFFIAITAPVGTIFLTLGISDFKSNKKKKTKKQDKPIAPKHEPRPDPKPTPKPEIKKPVVEKQNTEISYFNGLTKIGVTNIIIMLVNHDDYPGALVDPLTASQNFEKLSNEGKKMYPYSVEQCQRVSKWIHANKLMGKPMEEIIKAGEGFFK